MIRTRLSLWNGFVLAIVLVLMGVIVYVTTRTSLYKGVDDDLRLRSTVMEQNWKEFAKQGALDPNPQGKSVFSIDPGQTEQAKLMMRLAGPVALFRKVEKWASNDEPFDQQMYTRSLSGQRQIATILLSGHRVRVSSVPLMRGTEVVGAAQFATDLQPVDAAISLLGRVCLIVLPIGLVITTLLGVFLTGRALRPVMAIVEAASRIEATSLSDRLPVHGNDEFAVLSQTFNRMLSSLQESFEKLNRTLVAQKQFVADASHELKTPLTAIKGRVGIALRKEHDEEKYREHIRAIGRSTDTMATIVSNLIIIARADEASLNLDRVRLQLQEVVEEAISLLPPDRRKSACIVNEISSELEVSADRVLVVRALVNLLDNAVRYSGEEGNVRVRASQIDGVVEIVVEDFGTGIDPAHLPQIFDRFYRPDSSRDKEQGGTGLGLSIVKAIAEAHGGSASIESAVGAGTRVFLRLQHREE